MQAFFQNGDEQVNGNGAPDLGAHGVGRSAVKSFDAEMLFEPFEEQFNLPAAAIQLGDSQGRDGEVVGQEDQRLAGFGITVADAADRGGIIDLGLRSDGKHGLVKTQAGGFVHRPGVSAGVEEKFLGASDEESARLVEPMESGEVEITAIHDVVDARLPDQLVEEIHVVNTARRNQDDRGIVALEIEQRMQFDGRLVPPEGSPRKQ